jgi:hypothetical protein
MFLNTQFMVVPASAAITRGQAVSMNSSGAVAATATATLAQRCGVCFNSPEAAGQEAVVQTGGVCDYGLTDGDLAVDDSIVIVLNAGVMTGMSVGDVLANAGATGAAFLYKVGRGLLVADVGTVGKFLIEL